MSDESSSEEIESDSDYTLVRKEISNNLFGFMTAAESVCLICGDKFEQEQEQNFDKRIINMT
jgi:hypothetical protein